MVPRTLWDYHTTPRWPHKYTPFHLMYSKEVVVPIKFIFPNLYISQATKMYDDESIVECLQKLWELDEQIFLVDFHQILEKQSKKP